MGFKKKVGRGGKRRRRNPGAFGPSTDSGEALSLAAIEGIFYLQVQSTKELFLDLLRHHREIESGYLMVTGELSAEGQVEVLDITDNVRIAYKTQAHTTQEQRNTRLSLFCIQVKPTAVIAMGRGMIVIAPDGSIEDHFAPLGEAYDLLAHELSSDGSKVFDAAISRMLVFDGEGMITKSYLHYILIERGEEGRFEKFGGTFDYVFSHDEAAVLKFTEPASPEKSVLPGQVIESDFSGIPYSEINECSWLVEKDTDDVVVHLPKFIRDPYLIPADEWSSVSEMVVDFKERLGLFVPADFDWGYLRNAFLFYRNNTPPGTSVVDAWSSAFVNAGVGVMESRGLSAEEIKADEGSKAERELRYHLFELYKRDSEIMLSMIQFQDGSEIKEEDVGNQVTLAYEFLQVWYPESLIGEQ